MIYWHLLIKASAMAGMEPWSICHRRALESRKTSRGRVIHKSWRMTSMESQWLLMMMVSVVQWQRRIKTKEINCSGWKEWCFLLLLTLPLIKEVDWLQGSWHHGHEGIKEQRKIKISWQRRKNDFWSMESQPKWNKLQQLWHASWQDWRRPDPCQQNHHSIFLVVPKFIGMALFSSLIIDCIVIWSVLTEGIHCISSLV